MADNGQEQVLVGEVGTLSDQVETQNQKIKYLETKFAVTANKVLASAFQRHQYMNSQFYFERWKQSLIKQKQVQKAVLDSVRHVERAMVTHYFQRWSQNGSNFKMQLKTQTQSLAEQRVI